MPLLVFFVRFMLRRGFSLLRWATFAPLTIVLAVLSSAGGALRALWTWHRSRSSQDPTEACHAVYMTATWLGVCQRTLTGLDCIVPVDDLTNTVKTYLVAEQAFKDACARARAILK